MIEFEAVERKPDSKSEIILIKWKQHEACKIEVIHNKSFDVRSSIERVFGGSLKPSDVFSQTIELRKVLSNTKIVVQKIDVVGDDMDEVAVDCRVPMIVDENCNFTISIVAKEHPGFRNCVARVTFENAALPYLEFPIRFEVLTGD